MSNKAIVFYTGELQETQEISLRQEHDVENIIFVPVESMDDLDTKILETTEQPFTVYNYLDDPNLVLALCDKMTNFTTTTGYDPKYYIWVEVSDSEQRKQVSKTKGIKPHVIVISEETLVRSLKLQLRKALRAKASEPETLHMVVSGGASKQLIGRAKRQPITRVMQPESFMTSGIVLSDDVAYGMLFDDVPNCFIYTSSEKNLLSWFNALIMNLAVSKREFPMLKAVIYAFEDERNQPMLGDDRDHQFVARHIVAALELFGKTEGIKIFKPNEMEEFKQYIALTDEELEERKLLMAQTQSHDTLYVDVTDMKMPDSIKAMKDRDGS